MRRTAEIVVEGIDAALDAAEPGVTCETVEEAWRETIAEHDIVKEDRIGYSMGLELPAGLGRTHREPPPRRRDGAAEGGHDVPHDPGIWTGDVGVEISETFHVTGDGAETLADFPAGSSLPDRPGRGRFPPSPLRVEDDVFEVSIPVERRDVFGDDVGQAIPVFSAWPPVWGVMRQFSRSQSGWSFGSGSGSVTSRAHP